MHFSLVKLVPNVQRPGNGLDDVILPLFHAFRRLGFNVEIRLNEPNPQSVNIIFGSCNCPRTTDVHFPPNSIVFNLEQLKEGSQWVNNAYMRHLTRFKVWDYSPRNAAFLRDKFGVSDVRIIKLGYVPEMARITPWAEPDVDLLFYGSVNARRLAVLERLARAGVKMEVLQGHYGTERDVFIARSKVVLNMHYYFPAILEVPRLGYLWANKKAVVSEYSPSSERPPELAGACLYCDYDALSDGVLALLADDKARAEQAEAGFAAFSAISLPEELKAVVGRRTFSPGKLPVSPASRDGKALWDIAALQSPCPPGLA